MLVGMYYRNSDVRVEEKPIPQIGPGEALVKIMSSGICGSDIMEWYRIKKAPIVLGHEVAGEVAEVGEGVTRFKPGDRVVVSHHVPCNTCRYCLRGFHTACETLHTTNFDPGGFSQYVRVPALQTDRGIFHLPDNVGYDEGSTLEAVGCVVRAQRNVGLRPGDNVLVIGSGISGLIHIALARALGAGKIMATDIKESRMKWALRMGADEAWHATGDITARVKDALDGSLADLVVVCATALPAFKQALACVERGGTVLTFGTPDPGMELPVPINDFWRNDIRLMPSYGSAPMDFEISKELIAAGRLPVKDMITHVLPLRDIQKGFDLVVAGEEAVKVIIRPND